MDKSDQTNVSHTSTYNFDAWMKKCVSTQAPYIIYHKRERLNENKKMIKNLDKKFFTIIRLVKYVTRHIHPHHTCVSIVNSYNLSLCENPVRTGTFHSGAIQQSHLFIMILLPYISCLSVGHIEYIWLLFSYIEIYMIYKFSFFYPSKSMKFPSLQCFKNVNFVKKYNFLIHL